MNNLIPGEILEDIECLYPEDSYCAENDALNFDTFGAPEPWKADESNFDSYDLPDLSNLYLDNNHSNFLNFISNVETAQDDLLDRRLEELDINSPPNKPLPFKNKWDKEKKFTLIKDSNPSNNPNTVVTGHKKNQNNLPPSPFDHDLKLIRKMGLFPISSCKYQSTELQFKIPMQWRSPTSVNKRHINAKTVGSGQDNLLMSTSEFDNILRIHLTQVSKNPKLQHYSGRWNFRLMAGQSQTKNSDTSPANKNSESSPVNNDNTNANDGDVDDSNKIKRFGRTSVACIRHGRKQIYLENNEKCGNETISPVKRAKWAIEDCYEQLYIILELIQSIKSGFGPTEKLKLVRDEKLLSLYESLTQMNANQAEFSDADSVFEEIINLDKGKKLVLRIAKTFKPTLKIKLVLEILKCKTLYLLLTQSTSNDSSKDNICNNSINNLTLELFNFVCNSIEQIASKRFSDFIVSLLHFQNANDLLSNLSNSKYGLSFCVILGNKIIQGLEQGQLNGQTCRILANLITTEDENLVQIIKKIKALTNWTGNSNAAN